MAEPAVEPEAGRLDRILHEQKRLWASTDYQPPNWEGRPGRTCGDHRTVGEHRALCADHGWCYPNDPCSGCQTVMGWSEVDALKATAVALEQENADLADLLDSIRLYIDWRYVTRQLTTEQKQLLADTVDQEACRNGEEPSAERWWDWPPCEVCTAPVEERDGGWFDVHGKAAQDIPINWAGVGLTPAHAHRPARVRAELEQHRG
jgi:hypothetical protein